MVGFGESWDEALFGGEAVKPSETAKPPEKETHDIKSASAQIKRQIAELGSKHAADPGGGYLEKIKELQDKAKKLEAHENEL